MTAGLGRVQRWGDPVEEIRQGNLLALPEAPSFAAWVKAWSSACVGVECSGIGSFFINSVRMVDHIVVMTKGGPNNATSLLLFHIYQVGFNFWDSGYAAALTVVLLVVLAAVAIGQFVFLDKRVHYQ